MSDAERLVREYLAAFSTKNAAELAQRFADDVTLRDWELGTVRGKEAVLAANEKIFAAVKTIEARPLRIYVDGSTAIAELDVRVDNGPPLLVVDVIELGPSGLIRAIRAYRC